MAVGERLDDGEGETPVVAVGYHVAQELPSALREGRAGNSTVSTVTWDGLCNSGGALANSGERHVEFRLDFLM
jgi:hypothetical protein